MDPALELLGPEYVGEENPYAKMFDMKAIMAKAQEVRETIKKTLQGDGVDWAGIGTWIGDKIGAAIADGIGTALDNKKTEVQKAVADWSRDVYNDIPVLPDMAEPH